ncbi:MAG: DNA replication/repair protein RecF, partial [Verrucomicrobia bacterium]|nr:DNA replication/repair protein RecF [Verrucomicrobiota bacterium]
MFLKSLYARHFRNFDELAVDFTADINEVVGANAQGKTSLLEALYFCLTGSSFRSAHLKDLIRHSHDRFFVEVTFEKQGVDHLLAVSYDGAVRRVFLNRAHCPSTTVLLGLMTGVAFTPGDVSLVKGAPAFRRRFLDLQIAQIDPLYVHHLSRYTKALKQRNALLRQKKADTLFCWEAELATSASYLVWKRRQAVQFLGQRAAHFFEKFIIDKTQFDLHYSSAAMHIEEMEALRHHFVQEYARKRGQELAYGMTLVGPHRDDLQILLNEKPFREFASEGQQHLAAISLKLAEWHYLKEEAKDIPLMIIDDFAVSLDAARK